MNASSNGNGATTEEPAWTKLFARVLPIDPALSQVHAVLQFFQLLERRPITAARLAEELDRRRPQTVGRILKDLERDGLAEHRKGGWWAVVPKGSKWTRVGAMTLQRLSGLPPPATALWCRIEDLWLKNGACWASVEYFACVVGLSEAATRRLLQRLQRAYLIEIDYQPADHPTAKPGRVNGRTNLYRPRVVVWCPKPTPELAPDATLTSTELAPDATLKPNLRLIKTGS